VAAQYEAFVHVFPFPDEVVVDGVPEFPVVDPELPVELPELPVELPEFPVELPEFPVEGVTAVKSLGVF